MSHSERCTKPGCGALKIIGQPCRDWDCPQKLLTPNEYKALVAENAALKQRLEEEESAADRLLTERDQAEEWANKLSQAIEIYFQKSIGEHSNMNNPWKNALALIKEMTALQESQP